MTSVRLGVRLVWREAGRAFGVVLHISGEDGRVEDGDGVDDGDGGRWG